MLKAQWTTTDELAFLKGLGTHRCGRYFGGKLRTPDLQRLEMLRGYRAQMGQRENWGEIDPVVVSGVLDCMIQKLSQSVQRGLC